MDEVVERGNFLGLVVHFGNTNKVIATLRGKDAGGEFAQVELQKTSDSMDIVIVIVCENVEVGLCSVVSNQLTHNKRYTYRY